MRKEEMENLVSTGYVEGKRARGRQTEPYLTYMQKIKEKTPIELIHLTGDTGVGLNCQIAAYVNTIWHPGKVSLIVLTWEG